MKTTATLTAVTLAAGTALAAGPITLDVSAASSTADVSAEFFTFIGSDNDAGSSPLLGQITVEADDFAAPTTLTLHDLVLNIQPAGSLTMSGHVNQPVFGDGDFTERFDGVLFAATAPIVATGTGPFSFDGVPLTVLGEATAIYDIVGLDPVTVPRVIDTALLTPASASLTDVLIAGDGNTVSMTATITIDTFTIPFEPDLIETRIDATLTVSASNAAGCNPADIAEPFGQLDLADINAFIAAFIAGDPSADLAPPAGTLDLADLTAFITAFSTGCP